jgi:glycosyltransferase involved in cell wall biosynthesis
MSAFALEAGAGTGCWPLRQAENLGIDFVRAALRGVPIFNMNVGIDITGLFHGHRTGVQNYYYGVLEGLSSLRAGNEDLDIVLIDRSVSEKHKLEIETEPWCQLRQHVPLGGLPTFNPVPNVRLLWRLFRLWNEQVRNLRTRMGAGGEGQLVTDIDVLQVWPWEIKKGSGRHVIMIPDLIPQLYPDLFDQHFIEKAKQAVAFARDEADAVVTLSEFVKQQLVEEENIAPERITVAYPGVDDSFREPLQEEEIRSVRRNYGVGETPYVLSVGYIDPRKNVGRVVRAFEEIIRDTSHKDLRLVLVGPKSVASDRVISEIASSGAKDRITLTGFVSRKDLRALYMGAEVFVYCSVHEGFGIPNVEAMASGCPVVSSNVTSIPEVCGDAAVLLDPKNEDAITRGIATVLGDRHLRSSLIEKGKRRAAGFTHVDCARKYVETFRSCAA